jgi:hypothetical protein
VRLYTHGYAQFLQTPFATTATDDKENPSGTFMAGSLTSSKQYVS